MKTRQVVQSMVCAVVSGMFFGSAWAAGASPAKAQPVFQKKPAVVTVAPKNTSEQAPAPTRATAPASKKRVVAAVARTVKVLDEDGSIIFSVTDQALSRGQRVAIVQAGEMVMRHNLPAKMACSPLPAESMTCDDLLECVNQGKNQACVDEFLAQGCRFSEARRATRLACRLMLETCLGEGGSACQAYVDNDCLGGVGPETPD